MVCNGFVVPDDCADDCTHFMVSARSTHTDVNVLEHQKSVKK